HRALESLRLHRPHPGARWGACRAFAKAGRRGEPNRPWSRRQGSTCGDDPGARWRGPERGSHRLPLRGAPPGPRGRARRRGGDRGRRGVRHGYRDALAGRSPKVRAGDARVCGGAPRMSLRNPWALVPVKAFERGKSRLSPVLSDEARAAFARALFDHVLDVLTRARTVEGVLVATDSLD